MANSKISQHKKLAMGKKINKYAEGGVIKCGSPKGNEKKGAMPKASLTKGSPKSIKKSSK